MLNLNRAMILGNSTRDAEMRYIPSGQAVTHFAVATNRKWTDKAGQSQEQVEYHEIVAWGKLGEIAAQIVKKGTKVYVEGRLQTQQWEGQDGAKRNKTEIVAENIIALSPKGAGSGDYTAPASQQAPAENYDQTQPAGSQAKPTSAPADKPTPTKSDETEATAPDMAKEADEIDLDEIPF